MHSYDIRTYNDAPALFFGWQRHPLLFLFSFPQIHKFFLSPSRTDRKRGLIRTILAAFAQHLLFTRGKFMRLFLNVFFFFVRWDRGGPGLLDATCDSVPGFFQSASSVLGRNPLPTARTEHRSRRGNPQINVFYRCRDRFYTSHFVSRYKQAFGGLSFLITGGGLWAKRLTFC